MTHAVNATWRPLIVGGVPSLLVNYREMGAGSPAIAFGGGHQQVVRKLMLRWAIDSVTNPAQPELIISKPDGTGQTPGTFLPRVVTTFTGAPLFVDGPFPYISRQVPHEHSAFGSDNVFTNYQFADGFLYAEQITGAGDVCTGTDDLGNGQYDELAVNVSYTSRPYRIITDNQLAFESGTGLVDESTLLRYVSFQRQNASIYQTLPTTTTLVWANDPGTPVLNKKTVIFTEGDVLLTWHQVPATCIPYTAIDSLPWTTNSAPVGGMPRTIIPRFATGTLVYIGASFSFYRWHDSQFLADITHRFKHYPRGANVFYRWDDRTGNPWQPIRFKSGDPFVPSADHTLLFKPEARPV